MFRLRLERVAFSAARLELRMKRRGQSNAWRSEYVGCALHAVFSLLATIAIVGGCNWVTVVGLSQDGMALMELKRGIADPSGILSSWVASDATPCKGWYGVSCVHLSSEGDPRGDRAPVVHTLNISDQDGVLMGTLSPSLGKLSSLVTLDLSGNNFSGGVPPELGNCSQLQYMDLSRNLLSGPIPSSLGSCKNLVHLFLSGNSLDGSMPHTLGQLQNLQSLHLEDNQISGQLPRELANCTELLHLDLFCNHLNGSIPPELGGMSKLVHLYMNFNELSGKIPTSIGNLSNVHILQLDANFLTGLMIPSNIGSLKQLRSLSLTNNSLTGTVPEQLGELQHLENIEFQGNRLSGSVPAQLANCSSLRIIEICDNQLNGTIAPEIAFLRNLDTLYVFNNSLTGILPPELGRHSNITHIDVATNQLSGPIPAGLCTFFGLRILILVNNSLDGEIPVGVARCTSISRLRIGMNKLTGSIPKEFGQNKHMYYFDVSQNALNGTIPPELGGCTNLTNLVVSSNQLTGQIPAEIGSLPELQLLNLSMNQLTGEIPSSFQNATQLYELDLSGNSLSGSFPMALFQLSNLACLSLNDNRFAGQIPNLWFGSSFPRLEGLHLGGNMFTGAMPPSMGQLPVLQTILDLSRNNLSGPIPPQLAGLISLERLDISSNNLSGNIPEVLSSLRSLLQVNLSYNPYLQGPLPSGVQWDNLQNNPSSFMGNPNLCVSSSQSNGSGLCSANSSPMTTHYDRQKRFSAGVIAAVAFVAVSVVLVVIAAAFASRRCSNCLRRAVLMKGKGPRQREGEAEEAVCILTLPADLEFQLRGLTFKTLMRATNNLSDAYIINKGRNSTIYKAVLPSGCELAVKAVHSEPNGNPDDITSNDQTEAESEKAFRAEIETVGYVKHRNLVRIMGFSRWKDWRLILLEYFPNGSLSDVLHRRKEGVRVGLQDWESRYGVALGTAKALEYLHHDCIPRIIHRDVKSSNILLDQDFVPKLADFGVAKLVVDNDATGPTTASKVVGTYGYIAPEYSFSMKTSEKVDVYGYGVVLLELLTGRTPLDPTLPDGMDLVTWVTSKVSQGSTYVQLVLDQDLVSGAQDFVMEEMLVALKVAIFCVTKDPVERPHMRDVAEMLDKAKLYVAKKGKKLNHSLSVSISERLSASDRSR